jgi:hypothetical protein
LSEGHTPDSLIARIMQAVPVPDKPLESHARMAASA